MEATHHTKVRTGSSTARSKLASRTSTVSIPEIVSRTQQNTVPGFKKAGLSHKSRLTSSAALERQALRNLDAAAVTDRERPLLKHGKRSTLAIAENKKLYSKQALPAICNDVTEAYRNISSNPDVLKEKAKAFMKRKKKHWLEQCKATGNMTEQAFKTEIWDNVREAVRDTYMEIEASKKRNKYQDTVDASNSLSCFESASSNKKQRMDEDTEMSDEAIGSSNRTLVVPKKHVHQNMCFNKTSGSDHKMQRATILSTTVNSSEHGSHQDGIGLGSRHSDDLVAHNGNGDGIANSDCQGVLPVGAHADNDHKPSRWAHFIAGDYCEAKRSFDFTDWDSFQMI